MGRIVRYSALAFFLMIFLNVSSACGQDAVKEQKMKLNELREKRAKLMMKYEEAMHNALKESEDKMARIKRDYRLAHDGCLNDKNKKIKELQDDYYGRVKLMIKEEEELVQLIGPKEAMNFGKTKAEKKGRLTKTRTE